MKKNNLLTGILIGLALPVLAGIVFELFYRNVRLFGKLGMPYVVVVLLNLLMVRYTAKKDRDKTMQGIMLVTFAFAVWVFMFRFNV
jgi:hypothetical protein